MARWIKLPNVAGNDRRRSQTCHAVGSQMLVLGGYPPGVYVDPTEPCDDTFIKVFDLNEQSVRTKGTLLHEVQG